MADGHDETFTMGEAWNKEYAKMKQRSHDCKMKEAEVRLENQARKKMFDRQDRKHQQSEAFRARIEKQLFQMKTELESQGAMKSDKPLDWVEGLSQEEIESLLINMQKDDYTFDVPLHGSIKDEEEDKESDAGKSAK